MIEMLGNEKKRRPNSPLLGFSFSRNHPLKRRPPKGASSREKLPAPWTKSHAAFLGGGMVDGQLDLDALAFATDLQLDAARARDPAAGGDSAGYAAAAAVQ
mgnify:CR=1 FL=1